MYEVLIGLIKVNFGAQQCPGQLGVTQVIWRKRSKAWHKKSRPPSCGCRMPAVGGKWSGRAVGSDQRRERQWQARVDGKRDKQATAPSTALRHT